MRVLSGGSDPAVVFGSWADHEAKVFPCCGPSVVGEVVVPWLFHPGLDAVQWFFPERDVDGFFG